MKLRLSLLHSRLYHTGRPGVAWRGVAGRGVKQLTDTKSSVNDADVDGCLGWLKNDGLVTDDIMYNRDVLPSSELALIDN